MAEILNLLYAGIDQVISIYRVLIVIYILMSWVPAAREAKFGQFLGKIVEPYLGFFRKFIPPFGMIDISPIIGLFALNFISMGVRELFNLLV